MKLLYSISMCCAAVSFQEGQDVGEINWNERHDTE